MATLWTRTGFIAGRWKQIASRANPNEEACNGNQEPPAYDSSGSQVPYRLTPNRGGIIQPKYLVMHYTAGRSAESSVNWLTNSDARASAHLVIGADGSITQLAPFNIKTWHAGQSRWNGFEGLNSHPIGIELDNPGALVRKSNGKWQAWFGGEFDDDVVIEAIHKHQTEAKGWHVFTETQMEAAQGGSGGHRP